MNFQNSCKSLGPGLLLFLAACSGSIDQASRPIAEVSAQFEEPLRSVDPESYLLGPKDVISVRTFREADLSFDSLTIDSSGQIAFPLVGQIQASGLTVYQLSDRIEAGLSQTYLRYPDVTVQVVEAVADEFVVEGAVLQSGVFELREQTTLVSAIARARGTSDLASRDDVVIFRTIDGQKMGALFDLTAIERGYLDDPKILAGDTIIVHSDGTRRAYLELLRASPLAAAVFRAVTN